LAPARTPGRCRSIGPSTSSCSTTWSRSSNCPGSASFLERNGIDVSYQTDVDTDKAPGSLLHHRLVFAIGHDEYWTQRMRDAFNRALALSTNLMFGSDSDDWRMRYAADRRTIVEWRDPTIDPVHNRRLDNGFFRTFGEPECKLMGVQNQWAAQRNLTAPPTSYTVVGPSSDPWLAAAGLARGDVIPGVVGYEWGSLIPGCFAGQVVPLMTTLLPGSNGVRHSADMVQATAPSGGRVFAMGTMELAWALDDLDGRTPNPQVVAFVKAALRDLTRPAPGRFDNPPSRDGIDRLGAPACPRPAHPPGDRAPGERRPRVRGQPPGSLRNLWP
jgi:hypothetical protein